MTTLPGLRPKLPKVSDDEPYLYKNLTKIGAMAGPGILGEILMGNMALSQYSSWKLFDIHELAYIPAGELPIRVQSLGAP